MKLPGKVVFAIATLALVGGAAIVVPNVIAADESSATSAKNVEQALKYVDQLNREVRGVQRTALNEQTIADANGVDASFIQAGTGTGDILEPFKVNSDVMKWAQVRADQLAKLGEINHDDTYNGAPSWAYFVQDGETYPSTMKSPKYEMGKLAFGPENLAKGFPDRNSSHNPVLSWFSELQTAEQGYGHYLTEISQLGNVAGIGVAQTASGATITVLEIAYDDGTSGHGTTQTVEEALKALNPESEPSVSTPADDETTPAEDETTPSDEETTPGSEETTPGSEETTPGNEESTPAEEVTTPGDEETTPGSEETTPGSEETTPAEEVTTPGDEETTPAEEVTTPGDTETTPSEDVTTPGSEETTPGNEETTPGSDESTPGSDESTPGNDESTPAEEETTPATTQPVEPAAAAVEITTMVGNQFELPSTVDVRWSNGAVTPEPVVWESYDASLLQTPGEFEVAGKVTVTSAAPAAPVSVRSAGTIVLAAARFDVAAPVTFDVTAKITVLAQSDKPYSVKLETPTIDVVTTIGHAPELPATTNVVWSDGSVTSEPIEWMPVYAEEYATAGTFTVLGYVNFTLDIGVAKSFAIVANVTVNDTASADGSGSAQDNGQEKSSGTANAKSKKLAFTGASTLGYGIAFVTLLGAGGALLLASRKHEA
ncbi:Ig-like domain-containing protein [Arcanobacterium haemolyticum]|nr:Ig-like domain-containing protein [Arcanobacterium haemolyticum]